MRRCYVKSKLLSRHMITEVDAWDSFTIYSLAKTIMRKNAND